MSLFGFYAFRSRQTSVWRANLSESEWKDIGSLRGWIASPFYRLPDPRIFGPTHLGIPARTATGNFCHGNTPPLPFHIASSRAPPRPPLEPRQLSLTLRRPIPVVLNDQVFDPCAWRSSSRPSCHPIREGRISPDPQLSDGEMGALTKREDQQKSWLAPI